MLAIVSFSAHVGNRNKSAQMHQNMHFRDNTS